jgi:hypothetical protein
MGALAESISTAGLVVPTSGSRVSSDIGTSCPRGGFCPNLRGTSFRGDAQHRTRNPILSMLCGQLDSGFALCAPRNDGIDGQPAAWAGMSRWRFMTILFSAPR